MILLGKENPHMKSTQDFNIISFLAYKFDILNGINQLNKK